MTKKTTSILAYITLIGWLIAFLAGDKEGAKFHLNQALVLIILNLINGVIAVIPIVGFVSFIISIALIVFWIMGLVAACKDEEKPLPIIGGFQILK